VADHDPPPGGEDPTELSETDLGNPGGRTPAPALGQLGDFELLREIGRVVSWSPRG